MPFVHAAGHRLEYAWHGPRPADGPTLVFLHEGLGSVSLWRDFPARVAEATGLGALVYSRWGYGASDPVTLPRPLTYMHDEARAAAEVLSALEVRDAVLIGHSDGASIALIYAGSEPRPDLRGLVLEAPHVFAEEVAIRSIAQAAEDYRITDLRVRLARHHRDPDGAFWGWNRAWLDPGFRQWNLEALLPGVKVPTLAIQGLDDAYGTLAQVEAIRRQSGAAVEVLTLPACGHAPHRDQPDATLRAIVEFVKRVA
jgi:pimeloyl-ACP methyl ester carboxylesterase